MTDTLRWGILGASRFARNQMGPAIHAARHGTLSAVATSSADKAEPFAAFAPGLKVHESYDALLADPQIDAVYIPLPNSMHVDWTLKAIDAGKHVLCEKPLALRAEEFDRVIAARDRSGLLVSEAYMIVHHPQWQRAKALVADGAIGSLTTVTAMFAFTNDDMTNIRNQADMGGGSLSDIGVYTYGSTRFVSGEEPEEVMLADIDRQNGVDTRAHVTVRFPSFRFSGYTSIRMAPFQEMVFHGTKAVLRVPAPFNPQVYGVAEIILQDAEQRVTVERFPAENHYVRQVEAFNSSVFHGTDWPCPLEFSRGTQAMIDMVLAAEQ